MKNFVVEIKSQTASFRNPDFQNFHKSLDLPPPTTIIGLAGAALGLPPLQAQEFFEESEFRIGVFGRFEGKCNDTWKYDKRHSNRGLRYDPELDGSVIQKEYLIQNTFLIAFSAGDQEKLEKLYSAFESPIYALTMGNSDSLAFVKSINSDVHVSKNDQLQHCMVEGDIVDEVMRLAPKNMEFSIYQSSSEPITYDLPIRFDYESDYGKRTVSSISTFSIISEKMKLNFEVEGLAYHDIFIPLFRL
ncbi:CRISPR-associated protein Cas5 [Rhodohalobacter halophilus]|uniref:CRISPR-associated protein Cas5 n=1 Tax=Rhodohalobacter halophilus TaxID=1812810 RepID=UPI00083FD3A4|nr:CRISPR-associated protein Cas5 [Rhodohalobacter halophilus]